ncbi:MAG: hypothetical protein HY680_00170 [Chloroflexi bacterium]|nr:hypothetical protein [Chloroflexota bacterium]
MRRVSIVAGVFLLALSLGVTACGGGGGASPTPTRAATTPTRAPATTTPSGDAGGGEVIKVIQHEGGSYYFEPNKFNLTLGKTYTLDFVVTKEFHTFTVDALGISIFTNPGEVVKVPVTPTKTGTFKLYCIPHEALGMIGEVTVS